jgi:hypothetical protein
MGSNNRLKFEGLEELRASLRRLPVDLRDDAEVIVFDSAKEAVDDIKAGYAKHRRSGDLADKVEAVQLRGNGTAFAGAIVQNKSKLAFIFENGTQARHTNIGANRGSMPAAHVFVPAVIRRRKEMYERLREMMRSHNLTVTG